VVVVSNVMGINPERPAKMAGYSGVNGRQLESESLGCNELHDGFEVPSLPRSRWRNKCPSTDPSTLPNALG
jgi:hypothetical protein